MEVSTLLRIILFMLLLTNISFSSYNKQERMIMLELCRKLKINFCTLVEEEIFKKKYDLADNLKYFNQENIFATVLRYDELINTLKGEADVHHRELFIIKGSTVAFENMMQNFKKLDIIHRIHQYLWLAFVEDHWIENEGNLSITYDCEFIIVRQISEIKYTLTETFEIGNQYFFSSFGVWNHEEGLKIEDPFIYTRRPHLNQTEVFLLFDSNSTGYETCKMCDEFLELMYTWSRLINIKFTQIQQPEADENDDTVLSYFYDELDKHLYICSDPIFLAPNVQLDRTTNPFFSSRLNWYIKHPQMELKSNFYLKPFDKSFRLAMILSILVGTVIILVISHVVKKGQRCATDDLFLALAYFCNQDGSNKLMNASERIVSLSLRLIGFVVISSFGAVIMSYWTAQPVKVPFIDLATFLRSDGYLVNGGVLEFVLSEAESEKLIKEFRIDFEDGKITERICNENIAVPSVDMEIYRSNIECDLYQIDKAIADVFMVAYLSIYNPIRGMLNYYIIRLYESGIRQRAVKNFMDLPFKKTEDKFQPIELQLMREVFMMPVGGILAGALLLVGEIFYKTLQARFKFIKKVFRSHKIIIEFASVIRLQRTDQKLFILTGRPELQMNETAENGGWNLKKKTYINLFYSINTNALTYVQVSFLKNDHYQTAL